MSVERKIGLFFGSFNPIHMGHMIIANIMAEHTDLSRVWFIVSPQNPFKPSKGLLHEFDRFDMVKAAIADNYKLEVSDVEFHLPRPSYTIDTLTVLKERHPQHEFRVILGSDNLNGFERWKNHEQILNHFGLYVYRRPESGVAAVSSHPNVQFVEAPMLEISATYIRQCIWDNKSIRYLVPEAVEQMIRLKNFYK
ncbi:MAG: nicotinate-nucleotide adenylyltransferase [Bacteroidetes bacterium]|nr:nicotinate-nucleotide adenylyltransferase [Bacteroidota bacterium]